MRLFFKNFVFTNAWVALAASMQTLETYYLTEQSPDLNYLFFVLFSTISLYCFQRINFNPGLTSGNHSERQAWQITNRGIIISLFIICGFISLALLASFDIKTIALVAIAGIFSVAYSASFLFGKRLREIPGIKIFVLTAVWVLVTQIIPMLQNNMFLQENILRIATRFLFVFSLCIAFDIRDMHHDSPGMKTIPQVIGHKGAVICGIILLGITCILYQYFLAPAQLYAMTVTAILAMLILVGTMKKRSELYYSGLTESLLIIQVISVMISYLFE